MVGSLEVSVKACNKVDRLSDCGLCVMYMCLKSATVLAKFEAYISREEDAKTDAPRLE